MPFRCESHEINGYLFCGGGCCHYYYSTRVIRPRYSHWRPPSFVSQESLGISCVCDDISNELLRGVRLHIATFIDGLENTDLDRAQLGLAHAYSRSRVKFDVNRADKHIIQSIAILDQMDKDLNTFAMRVREWYSWHFPEMVKVHSPTPRDARSAHHPLRARPSPRITKKIFATLEHTLLGLLVSEDHKKLPAPLVDDDSISPRSLRPQGVRTR